MPGTFRTLEREKEYKNPSSKSSIYPLLHEAVLPHVGSFNALTNFEGGGLLNLGVKDIGSKVVYDANDYEGLGNKLEFRIASVHVSKPYYGVQDKLTLDRKIMPSECRERMSSYNGRLILTFAYRVNGGEEVFTERDVGAFPIMLRSNLCHLNGLSPAQLVNANEESEEMGGYFIVNGNEKLIRMLIVQKRNHPMAIERNSFTKRGPQYTKYGIQIRCVRPDQTALTNVLHYLSDGSITFRFSWRKSEYLVPIMLILKCLVETNDREIFDAIAGSDLENSFLTDRLEMLLRAFKPYNVYTKKECLSYLGDKFRMAFAGTPEQSDAEVGEEVLKRVVLVHLPGDNQAKFRLLLFMMRKLYSLVAGECCPDNPDATQHQEILLGGFLYAQIVKEKIEEYLFSFRAQIAQDVRRQVPVNFNDSKYLKRVFSKINENLGAKLQYFLSTGNLVSQSGLDLQQVAGFTVVAEKINFHRFLAHFRMVHRGAFFAELKTTTVRKLLPESWGFLCPVHTPDGAPCGLLNHLAHKCLVTTSKSDVSGVPSLLRSLGVSPPETISGAHSHSVVVLDGQIIGWCSKEDARRVSDTLRFLKVEGNTKGLPKDLEIGYVPHTHGGQYPGVFLFSGLQRMTRPVKYLPTDEEDWVGAFEQVYMNIAVTPEEITNNVHTHVEYTPTNIFSILANLTPFSDFNQSPRNMYQCQMGKQTMGTPGTGFARRSDNKLYHLQTGQTPIVKTGLYDDYGMDEFPNGTNAVVAVISYTGYDMDDAMILNKSALERGFGHGSIYKTEKIDLSNSRKKYEPITKHFGFGTDNWPEAWLDKLDQDGLPIPGVKLKEGDPMVAYYDDTLAKTKTMPYHSSEPAYVQDVKLVSDDNGDQEFQSVIIKMRLDRSPNIGDKFSSRHGQKGVCSQKWPDINMPFSETGIRPDVIINPHAFPSRMTIGMFVESLAGKAGALHGIAQEATPFSFSEENTAADYFGEQLQKAGFNFHGNEPMYSGVTGEELRVDIYIGVVYYQRLRHMVNDKYQVRSTGAVNRLTRQPVKGRKKGGGIRIGEMERDAFIGHGTAYLLQDRLLNCSDYTQTHICKDCGSIISTQRSIPRVGQRAAVRCRNCAKKSQVGEDLWEDGHGQKFRGGDNIATVAVPYVFKYLDSELLAMGIKMKMAVVP